MDEYSRIYGEIERKKCVFFVRVIPRNEQEWNFHVNICIMERSCVNVMPNLWAPIVFLFAQSPFSPHTHPFLPLPHFLPLSHVSIVLRSFNFLSYRHYKGRCPRFVHICQVNCMSPVSRFLEICFLVFFLRGTHILHFIGKRLDVGNDRDWTLALHRQVLENWRKSV